MARRRIWHGLKTGDLMHVLDQAIVLLNGFLLPWSIQIPFRGSYESVQTPKGIEKALHAAGFIRVETELRRDGDRIHFAVLAEKI
jgi:hypothetical protein